MAPLFARPEFDFGDYVLDHVEVHQCNYNWKTFIEVYLEDYHVGPFHPGLGRFVTCDDLTWEFNDWYSLQKVGVHNALAQPGSDVYKQWHDRLLSFRDGDAPDFGAVWVTYFPTHMIELYPHVLVLSTLYPKSPAGNGQRGRVLLPEEIAAFEREFVEAQRRLHGNGDRGRRDRRAHGRRPQSPDAARRERDRPLPVADGRRHAALPRVVSPHHAGAALRPPHA
ncbi:SRPBCC family protein [Achromobacter insuavis]